MITTSSSNDKSKNQPKTLIVVVGPTAIGKTALGIKLAKYFNTEIISADSRQFFKEMEIGTAVPSKEELAAVPHHFIQNLSIHNSYSVGQFEKDALEKINLLFEKKDIVVVVGGSGLYIDAICKGLDDFPDTSPEVKSQLNTIYENKGLEKLTKLLQEKDPETYQSIDLNNHRRVLRALEVCLSTGKPYSSFLNTKKRQRPFQCIKIGIQAPREIIYQRINLRVDLMMQAGLLQEVKGLLPYKKLNALNTVGYKELFDFFEEKCDLEKSIEEIKKHTRRFAKRQLTWLRRDPDIIWVTHQENISTIIEIVSSKLTKLRS